MYLFTVSIAQKGLLFAWHNTRDDTFYVFVHPESINIYLYCLNFPLSKELIVFFPVMAVKLYLQPGSVKNEVK